MTWIPLAYEGDIVTFSGIHYLAVVVAAVASWFASSFWYMSLRKPYAAALGKAPVAAFGPYFFAFIADLIIAWMITGLLGHLGAGQVTLRNGVISGAFVWFGFVLTTMAVNYAFSGRDRRLLLIDAGNWLIVLLVAGAVIGLFG
jgi:hypothetical protein